MALHHRTAKSNDVRAPDVPRGEAIIVERYKEPKVALVNPEDLAEMEAAYDALMAVGQLEPLPVDEAGRAALAAEDRPAAKSLEDPAALAALFGP